MSGILETLQGGGHLLGDGAMGTMLQDAGLTDGGAPELWNVDHPEKIEPRGVRRGWLEPHHHLHLRWHAPAVGDA